MQRPFTVGITEGDNAGALSSVGFDWHARFEDAGIENNNCAVFWLFPDDGPAGTHCKPLIILLILVIMVLQPAAPCRTLLGRRWSDIGHVLRLASGRRRYFLGLLALAISYGFFVQFGNNERHAEIHYRYCQPDPFVTRMQQHSADLREIPPVLLFPGVIGTGPEIKDQRNASRRTLVNIALGRGRWSRHSHEITPRASAGRAVDGALDSPGCSVSRTSQSAKANESAWWEVALGIARDIDHVEVTLAPQLTLFNGNAPPKQIFGHLASTRFLYRRQTRDETLARAFSLSVQRETSNGKLDFMDCGVWSVLPTSSPSAPVHVHLGQTVCSGQRVVAMRIRAMIDAEFAAGPSVLLGLCEVRIFAPPTKMDAAVQLDGTGALWRALARSGGSELPQGASCNLAVGNWVWDPSREVPSGYFCGCRLDRRVHCGATFLNYTYWTWQPIECSIPPFSADRFVGDFAGHSVRFVGDSLVRGQANSLGCMMHAHQDPIPPRGGGHRIEETRPGSINPLASCSGTVEHGKQKGRKCADAYQDLGCDIRWCKVISGCSFADAKEGFRYASHAVNVSFTLSNYLAAEAPSGRNKTRQPEPVTMPPAAEKDWWPPRQPTVYVLHTGRWWDSKHSKTHNHTLRSIAKQIVGQTTTKWGISLYWLPFVPGCAGACQTMPARPAQNESQTSCEVSWASVGKCGYCNFLGSMAEAADITMRNIAGGFLNVTLLTRLRHDTFSCVVAKRTVGEPGIFDFDANGRRVKPGDKLDKREPICTKGDSAHPTLVGGVMDTWNQIFLLMRRREVATQWEKLSRGGPGVEAAQPPSSSLCNVK